MALTADEILVRMVAQNQQYLDAMRKAQSATSSVDQQLKVLRETMSVPLATPQGGLRSLIDQTNDAQKAVRNLQFNLPNLAAQINDIGVTAAGGMQPWLIALQQGTQLNQAFAGQTARQALVGMKDAFLSVIQPQSLFVLGAVAGAAALIQFGMGLFKTKKDVETFSSSMEKAKSALAEMERMAKDHAENGLETLREKYGEVTAEILLMSEAMKERNTRQAEKALKDRLTELNKDYGATWAQTLFGDRSSVTVPKELVQIDFIVQNIIEKLKMGGEDTKEFRDALSGLFSSKTLPEMMASLQKLRPMLNELAKEDSERGKAADVLLGHFLELEDKTANFLNFSNEATGSLSKSAIETKKLADEMDRARESADKMAEKGRAAFGDLAIRNRYASNSVRAAAGIADSEFTRGMSQEMLADEGISKARREYVEMAANAELVRIAVEGISRAEKEVASEAEKSAAAAERDRIAAEDRITTNNNELRVAEAIARYGKDSEMVERTRADIAKETYAAWVESLRVSEETKQELLDSYDAAQGITSSGMAEAFSASAAEARNMASELAVALNLVASIVRLTGSIGISNVGRIAELSALNAGKSRMAAAADRDIAEERARLSDSIGSSEAIVRKSAQAELDKYITARRQQLSLDEQIASKYKEISDSGRKGSKGGGGGGSSKALARSDDQILKDIAALNAEADALEKLTVGEEDYGSAVARARKEAEILQQLQNKGVPITEDVREGVAGLARDYQEAADRAEAARNKHEEFQHALESFRSTQENAFVGLVTGAHSFRDALGMVIAKLAEMMAVQGFETLWGSGLGSISSGVMSFLGLKPYSSGGYTGPGGVNTPAGLVHKGEIVWSQQDIRRAGGIIPVEMMRRGQLSLGGFASGGIADTLPIPRTYVQPQKQAEPRFSLSIGVDSGHNLVAIVRNEAGKVVAEKRQSIIVDSVKGAMRASLKTKDAFGIR